MERVIAAKKYFSRDKGSLAFPQEPEMPCGRNAEEALMADESNAEK